MKMPGTRVKIDFEDAEGSAYTISVAGHVSKDKLSRVMEMVELLNPQENTESAVPTGETTFGRLYSLIETKFPLGSFGSPEILEAYEDEFKKPIRLSTISTYLQRFHDRGLLTRQRSPSGWNYRRTKPTDY